MERCSKMSVKALVTYRSAAASKVTLLDSKEEYPAILRKKLKKYRLYAGDYVSGEIVDNQFVIEAIEPRRNILIRPPVANVDRVFVVMAMQEPPFDSYLLDNFLAVFEYYEIEPIIILNKVDLLESQEKLQKWQNIYQNIGYKVVPLSIKEDISPLKSFIKGITTVAGPSGAGKSTILSRLLGVALKTGEVNHKLKRGRHTTTAITLYPFNDNSFVADTPGFSKVEATFFMDKKEVHRYFKEFNNYSCKYPNCTHTTEPECGVKEAVLEGKIACERFKNYLKIMHYYWEELPC